jgi:Flp pilus assembly pilin Flp
MNLKKYLKIILMKKAQSVLEYALIISVVAAAMMAMSVYVQRSVQSNLKTLEERVNAEPAR